MDEGLHIAIAAERLWSPFGIPVTNALLTAWVVMALLTLFAVLVGTRLRAVPGRTQAAVESLFEYVLTYSTAILGSGSLARRYFPLLMTIFLFVLTANLFHFLPVVGSVVVEGHGHTTSLFRAATTDLNFTLALAIIAVIAIEIAGIVALGALRYGSKFINFSSPVNFVVGLIELISELSRFVSFSFRLFGNIFAGEVLLAVVALFVPYFLPVPLMMLEVFVAVIQAAVFSMLTLFFIKMAVAMPHGQGSAAH